jgi:hypothetical protein
VDIAVQAMEGAAQSGQLVQALATGDKVDANDVGFEHRFPYVALPNNQSVNSQTTAAVAPKASTIIGDMPPGALIGGAVGALVLLGGTVYLWRKRPTRARHRSMLP